MTNSTSNKISINKTVSLNISFDIDIYIQKVLTIKNITSASIDFNFIENKDIIELNQKYLKRDYPTDIISFNLGESQEIIGDVYISVEQAKINAIKYNNKFDDEIKLLVIHGILHLLDYRDYTNIEKKEMKKEEERILLLLSK